MSDDSRTKWKEVIGEGEEARFRDYADEIRAMQLKTARGGKIERALHTKRHACVSGQLTVRHDLPDELKVSLFAKTGPQRCALRFSNGTFHRQADRAPDVRGVALKVFEVPGRKLLHGLEGCTTQDFLFIGTPTFSIGTPADFMKLLRVLHRGPQWLVPGLIGAFGWGRAFATLKGLAKMPKPASMATGTFFTAAPHKLGAFAAKFSLLPHDLKATMPKGRDGYRDELTARLKAHDIVFTLRAQLFVDEARTPIEDAAVLWPDALTPWIDVATVTVPMVDLTSPESLAAEQALEELSFDPWHCTEDLRPLGAVMRARKLTYAASVVARNGAQEP